MASAQFHLKKLDLQMLHRVKILLLTFRRFAMVMFRLESSLNILSSINSSTKQFTSVPPSSLSLKTSRSHFFRFLVTIFYESRLECYKSKIFHLNISANENEVRAAVSKT